HRHRRAGRWIAQKELGIHFIHCREVTHRRQEDRRLDDLCWRAARRLQHRREVLQRPPRLLPYVALTELAGLRIKSHLTGGEDHIAGGNRRTAWAYSRWSIRRYDALTLHGVTPPLCVSDGWTATPLQACDPTP